MDSGRCGGVSQNCISGISRKHLSRKEHDYRDDEESDRAAQNPKAGKMKYRMGDSKLGLLWNANRRVHPSRDLISVALPQSSHRTLKSESLKGIPILEVFTP
jgi:hypothetical protein